MKQGLFQTLKASIIILSLINHFQKNRSLCAFGQRRLQNILCRKIYRDTFESGKHSISLISRDSMPSRIEPASSFVATFVEVGCNIGVKPKLNCHCSFSNRSMIKHLFHFAILSLITLIPKQESTTASHMFPVGPTNFAS